MGRGVGSGVRGATLLRPRRVCNGIPPPKRPSSATDCGRENFQRYYSVALDLEEPDDADAIREMIEEKGLDGDRFRHRTIPRPDHLTCRQCGAECKAVDTGEGDEEAADEDE